MIRNIAISISLLFLTLSANAQYLSRGELTHSFTHAYAQYSADPEAFDCGFYGLGFTAYGSNGIGGTFSLHGNWGIADPGQFMAKFGPTYGFAVNQHFMVNGALRGFIYTYDVLNGKTATSTEQKVSGGITLTPGISFKFDKIFIDAGFEFGWANGNDQLYKAIELGLGYAF